jgi:hypothetical protein
MRASSLSSSRQRRPAPAVWAVPLLLLPAAWVCAAAGGGGQQPPAAKDPLAYKVHEWPGGTYATFDGWPVGELPNGLGGRLYATCPPGRERDFNLLLLVVTPEAPVLARVFEVGPQLVAQQFPQLRRDGGQAECTFGGDVARVEQYRGQWEGKEVRAQAIYVRKKDVALLVFGVGTEAGFKEFGRAPEIVAQSISFKESPLEPQIVGTWTFSAGQRRELSSGNRVSAASDVTVTIYPNGSFTKYSSGSVTGAATAGDSAGSADWLREGRGRGRLVKRGDVLTFHYDDGKTWSGAYRLEGNNGLRLGTALYARGG